MLNVVGAICALMLLQIIGSVGAKVFTKCSLAHELIRQGVPRSELFDWVCIAENESLFQTRAVNTNRNLTKDWGLFMINDALWCDPQDGRKTKNACKLTCSELLGSDITSTLRCAQLLKKHGGGFTAWPVWRRKCRDRRRLTFAWCGI